MPALPQPRRRASLSAAINLPVDPNVGLRGSARRQSARPTSTTSASTPTGCSWPRSTPRDSTPGSPCSTARATC